MEKKLFAMDRSRKFLIHDPDVLERNRYDPLY